MSYKTRSARRVAKKGRRNFIITLLLIGFILFATLNWILPTFINGVGFVRDIVKPSQKVKSPLEGDPMLAAPVLNIPYEATGSSEISISGYSTPNSKVKLFIDDEEVKETEVGDDGTFKFENISLSIGTNNIFAKTVDDKGKESLPSKTFKVIYDNDKPNLSINEPEDNKKIQGGVKSVKVSGKSEPDVKVFINDNQTVVDKEGNFSSEILINEGDNTISIKAMDLAKNTTEIQRKVNYTP